jgi:hypothetical protein
MELPVTARPASLAAFAAGTIDAIAGGGGLITVPSADRSGAPPARRARHQQGPERVRLARRPRQLLAPRGDRPRARRRSFLLRLRRGVRRRAARAQVPRDAAAARGAGAAGVVAACSPFRRDVAKARAERSHRGSRSGVAIAFVIGAYDGFFGPARGPSSSSSYVTLLAAGATDGPRERQRQGRQLRLQPRGGERVIRFVVLSVVTALVLKLGWDLSR